MSANTANTATMDSETYDHYVNDIFPEYMNILKRSASINHNHATLDDLSNFLAENFSSCPNITNTIGESLLHCAIKGRCHISYNAFKIILNIGVDVNLKDNKDRTIMDMILDYRSHYDHGDNILMDIIDNLDYDDVCKIMTKAFLRKLHENNYCETQCKVSKMTDIIAKKISKKSVLSHISVMLLELNRFYNENERYSMYRDANDIANYRKKIDNVECALIEFAKNIDFRNKFKHDREAQALNIFEYIHANTNMKSKLVRIITLVGELMSLKNCIFAYNNNNVFVYYLTLSVLSMPCKTQRLINAQHSIQNMFELHFAHLLEKQTDGVLTPIMIILQNGECGFASKCIKYIMDNIDKINANECNIINAHDDEGNNILHYIFSVCDDRTNTIFKEFHDMIVNSEYKKMIYEVNKTGNIPYGVALMTNYFTFGNSIITMDDIVKVYEHDANSTLMHGLMLSSKHDYQYYKVEYVPYVTEKEAYVMKNVTNYKLPKSYSAISNKMPDDYAVCTSEKLAYLRDGPEYVMKSYIYRQFSTLDVPLSYESYANSKNISMLSEFYKLVPSAIHNKDMKGRTCFLLSAHMNSIKHVKFFVDYYKSNSVDFLTELMQCDSNGQNIFHYIAHNNNRDMLVLIYSYYDKEEKTSMLHDHIAKKNNDHDTPFDICTIRKHLDIFHTLLLHTDFSKTAFMKTIMAKICYRYCFNENEADMLRHLEKITKNNLHNVSLRSNQVGGINCPLLHFCAYNKYYSILRYMIITITMGKKYALNSAIDSNGLTVLGVGVSINDANIIDMLCNFSYVASRNDYLKILELAGPMNRNDVYKKLIRNDIIDINFENNGITLLHKACEYGNMEIVKEIINKNVSNGNNNVE